MSENRTSSFAAMVHRILVVEKRRPAKEVAAALGMKYATFYARMIGRVPFDPDEINALIREIPDSRLVDRLLSETPFVGVPRQAEPMETQKDNASLVQLAVHSVEESVGALREMTIALDDGGIGPTVRVRIESHIIEAERDLAALRLRLDNVAA